jgi:glutamate-1-semialdehyde 2,1-aminomutase
MNPRTNSDQMLARSRQSLAGGVSSNVRAGKIPPPMFFKRGEGPFIFDVDGNRYIDYVLGQGPAILGHSPRRVLERVEQALQRGQLFAGQCDLEISVSEMIQKLVPCAELVRYSNSGSEIVQAALRLARAYTGREKIIKFEGHYHGWFDNVLVSVSPPLEKAGPHDSPVALPGSQGQLTSAFQDTIVLPWNDLSVLERTVQVNPEKIAAVIMEPVMCNIGCIPPSSGYLEGVRKICTKHGIVLIFDEIITGFRLSKGGAQGFFGVTPDLATFGKAIAGGFPISCLAGKREMMELIGNGLVNHSGTYNSNVMVIAAAAATLDELNQEGIYERLSHLTTELKTGLKEIFSRAGLPARFSGVGPVFHLGFGEADAVVVDYRSFVKSIDTAKGQRFADLLLQYGVRFIPRGIWYMSTAHTEAEIEATLKAVQKALKEFQEKERS